VLPRQPLLDALERMSYGGLLLNTAGHVVAMNGAAEHFFERELGTNERDILACDRGREAIKKLLARGDADAWVVVPREEQKPLILHAIALAEPAHDGPHTVLILIDLDRRHKPNTLALQRIFGLTAAEARLAQLIARGDAPTEIAQAHGLSLATVRSQLASVFDKTQTRRQAELVALVTQLSILP
jgi:DNA-binding CsgD family transcriptional regulator